MAERRNPLSLLLFVSLLALPAAAGAREIFVSTAGKDTNSGDSTAQALRTIAAASGRAQAGDVVQIMPGRYNEAIRPIRSGQPSRPIMYRSYGPEHAVLTHERVKGLESAIDIQRVNDIVVDGIDVDGVARAPQAHVAHFATIYGGTRITIRNGKFRYAHGWWGIGAEKGASFVRIENNDIDWVGMYDSGSGSGNSDTGDAIMIGKSGGAKNVLIAGNTIRHGGHNLLAIFGEDCVIQDNQLDNSYRDVMGGDVGGRPAAFVGDGNVIQYNTITGAGASSDNPGNTLMKVEGSSNVARYNALYDGVAVGVSSSARQGQPHASQLRIYNNTFYRLGGAAWRLEMFNGGNTVGDNVFMNNLVEDSRLPAGSNDLVFKVERANAGPTARSTVLSNTFGRPSQATALLQGFDGVMSLDQAQSKYPQFFTGNRVVKNAFVSANPKMLADFDLAEGSPAVDKGAFLTKVTAAGRSKSMRVGDSQYFSDGNGLVAGDLIQLQGSQDRVRVVTIDRRSNTLVLSSELQFTAGQGVSLAYEGAAPDIGAREFGALRKPSPPSEVAAQ